MSRTDIKGNIISVSEAFCNISGFSEEELIKYLTQDDNQEDLIILEEKLKAKKLASV